MNVHCTYIRVQYKRQVKRVESSKDRLTYKFQEKKKDILKKRLLNRHFHKGKRSKASIRFNMFAQQLASTLSTRVTVETPGVEGGLTGQGYDTPTAKDNGYLMPPANSPTATRVR